MNGLLAVALIPLVVLGIGCPNSTSAVAVPEGTWGGEGIQLTVTATGGQFDLGCAHGSIDEPLKLDGQARFQAKGRYVKDRPGPVREDQQEDSHPARYTGTVKGDTMTFTVTVTDGSQPVATYRLKRGRNVNIVKCV